MFPSESAAIMSFNSSSVVSKEGISVGYGNARNQPRHWILPRSVSS